MLESLDKKLTIFMKNKILQILLVILSVIGLNIIANRFFFRIDLTQEKRYTIHDATKNLLGNLQEIGRASCRERVLMPV